MGAQRHRNLERTTALVLSLTAEESARRLFESLAFFLGRDSIRS